MGTTIELRDVGNVNVRDLRKEGDTIPIESETNVLVKPRDRCKVCRVLDVHGCRTCSLEVPDFDFESPKPSGSHLRERRNKFTAKERVVSFASQLYFFQREIFPRRSDRLRWFPTPNSMPGTDLDDVSRHSRTPERGNKSVVDSGTYQGAQNVKSIERP